MKLLRKRGQWIHANSDHNWICYVEEVGMLLDELYDLEPIEVHKWVNKYVSKRLAQITKETT